MAGPSRIDELRKKFDENPRRYFAPLANEYRKIGDFDQAIFICQEFLPQQPGHMSGHIVYGQALFEAGRHDEARSVFETALALDPENLIALRHLGDIARAHGDNETARAWYHRVLESDPRNEEIAGILSSLDADEGSTAHAAPPSQSVATDVSSEKVEIESAMSSAVPEIEKSIPAMETSADQALTSAPSESTFDELAKLFTSPEAASAPVATSEPAPASESSGVDKLDLIHEGEDVLGRAAQMQNAAEATAIDGVASAAAEATTSATPTPTFAPPFLEALSAEPPPPAASPAPPSPAQEPAPSNEAAPDGSAPFVTETMAELYLRQGHLELAIDTYRKLVALHPEDAALRARLSELERPSAPPPPPPPAAPAVAAEAGPTIREFLASIAGFRPRKSENGASAAQTAAPAASAIADRPAPRPNADTTVGTSLHALFVDAEGQDQLRNAAPVTPPPPPADLPFLEDSAPASAPPLGGKPAAPAPNELSLDHVFRHATPAAAAGAQPSSFSFDQFFSQQAHKDASPSESESSTEGNAGPSDDIQQFNAWLEGLKKT